MDSKSIRYKNTRLLVEQIGGVSNFAEKLGKGQSQISQFAGSNPIKGIGNKVAREIETIFCMPHGWLDIPHHSTELNQTTSANTHLYYLEKPIPIISWHQAKNWNDADYPFEIMQHSSWLPPNPKCGNHGFGLEVAGESMQPDFRPNDKIYINTDFEIINLKTGDLVIVACEKNLEATFKKLIVESGNFYLQSLNPNWPEKTIALANDCKIVGQVIGLYRDV